MMFLGLFLRLWLVGYCFSHIEGTHNSGAGLEGIIVDPRGLIKFVGITR